MADDPNAQAREQQLARDRDLRAKSYAEFEKRTQGVKPTPTQDENDRAALGEHIVEHEPDGSPEEEDSRPDPRGSTRERHMQADRGASYQTRAQQPQQRQDHQPQRQPQKPG
jgi:hypothetical protein